MGRSGGRSSELATGGEPLEGREEVGLDRAKSDRVKSDRVRPDYVQPERAAELVARIRDGDLAAEAELVEHYRRGVAFILRRMLGDHAEVDDLFQETFRLTLLKVRGNELHDPRRLSGFVSSLARNLAIESFRRAARHPADARPETVEGLVHDGPTPLASLLVKERAALVRRVLGELGNKRDRQMLFRFYLAEEEKEVICKDLGLSSLHFNRVLHRARQRYLELYEKTLGSA